MEYNTKACMVCGKTSQLIVELEDFQMWRSGVAVQDVWPDWTPDQRELLITGTHPECWDEMFKEEE